MCATRTEAPRERGARALLARMQALISRLYDTPAGYDVGDFLFSDRRRLADILAAPAENMSDEQVVLVQDGGTMRVGLYLDAAVLERLSRQDPLESLHDANLADY